MLFVSCQPYEDEDYYTKDFILKMSKAAELGGAKGLRIEGRENINYIKKNIKLPVIGLIKNKKPNRKRYICPSLDEIEEVLTTNCESIAIDFTLRDKCDKDYYLNIIDYIRQKRDIKIVADVATIKEAELANNCKVDYITTALRGYTDYSKNVKIPDIEIIRELKMKGCNNIIAEGGYSTHSQYIQALKNGAVIVVIGTAISRPHLIVKHIISGNY